MHKHLNSTMSTDYAGVVDFAPKYASYNWTGPPSDTNLATNSLGGDSSMASLSPNVDIY